MGKAVLFLLAILFRLLGQVVGLGKAMVALIFKLNIHTAAVLSQCNYSTIARTVNSFSSHSSIFIQR